ncbi:hypothetical protein [Allofournierella massiliensis]|uniref:Uncharacterized protein n=1 Tax=Allofournierella massiliensis TaxID=1650663 RepID=A0A4R1QXG6_9FIRM|nr:hypothetical protein [Fournierella massiliensis]TCL56424.1 hypothetical protein EDD77_11390 [Fournierella massiliensis]
MNRAYLIHELNHLKVQTGSLACMGCQHEDNCGIKGCALIRAAVEQLEVLQGFEEWLQEQATSDKKQAIGDDPDESTQKASGKRLS